jgi:hypothetical protein
MTSTLMTAPVAALLAVFAALRFHGPAGPHLRAGLVCHGVEGSIEGRANRLRLDLRGFKAVGGGSIAGALEGDVRLEVRREGRRGPDTELSILLTAATAAGPLRLEGTAWAQRERPEDPFHRVRGWLAVSDGTPEGARGRVSVEGTADTDTRAVAIQYAGELCDVPEARIALYGTPGGRP